MNKIIRQHFRVENFEALSPFYTDLLGMQAFDESKHAITFGFDKQSCCLEFHKKPVQAYVPESNDFYWKIGITLRDLDAAINYIRKQGISVPDPYQFRDIGYMSKITDPNGFVIELLQQGFEGRAQAIGDGHPIGSQAILAHITLRVTDIAQAKQFFERQHGMRLMSVQPVDQYGFCLYFYSFSDEDLPNEDLTAVENREWLWRRPYTFIELQHLQLTQASIHKTAANMAGFDGFSYTQQNSKLPVFISARELKLLV